MIITHRIFNHTIMKINLIIEVITTFYVFNAFLLYNAIKTKTRVARKIYFITYSIFFTIVIHVSYMNKYIHICYKHLLANHIASKF